MKAFVPLVLILCKLERQSLITLANVATARAGLVSAHDFFLVAQRIMDQTKSIAKLFTGAFSALGWIVVVVLLQ